MDAGGRAAAACGSERWPVKTLTDPQAREVEFGAVRPATVAALGKLAVAKGGQTTRSSWEKRVYGINATLAKAKLEEDGDVHLVLTDGDASIIVEMPSVACTRGAQHRYAMAAARRRFEDDVAVRGHLSRSRWLYLRRPTHVVGVLFFDYAHGQTGHAPNYVELHPVLGFRWR
jgi:hypothetical protein